MFGNDGNENEKPGIQEQYETAGNTSDLTVEADRRGAGDVMVGAGFVTHVEGAPAWSATRTGMALLRLHSEWNAVAKPRKPTKEMVDAFTADIRAEDAREKGNREKANGELARLEALQDLDANFDRAVEIMEIRKLYAKGALPLPIVQRGNAQERAQLRAQQWYTSELRLLANSLKSRQWCGSRSASGSRSRASTRRLRRLGSCTG
jgi:hypothetical protein